MTPLPKRRHSSGRQGKRRSAIKTVTLNLVECENCKTLKLTHKVCPNCGTYKGQVFVAPKVKTKVTKVNTEK